MAPARVQGLRTRRAEGINSSPEDSWLEMQEELLLPWESEAGKDLWLNCQAGGIIWHFFFYSGLHLIGWGPPTWRRTLCFSHSIDSNFNLIQKHPHSHIHRIMFDQLSGHPAAQSGWQIKLSIKNYFYFNLTEINCFGKLRQQDNKLKSICHFLVL